MLLLLLETNPISCLSNIHIFHKITKSLLTMSNRSLSPSLIHCTKFDVTCACSLTRYLISAFALFLSHGIDETSLASLEVSTCHPCPAAAMMAGGRPIISTISSSEWWRQTEQVRPPLPLLPISDSARQTLFMAITWPVSDWIQGLWNQS